MDVVTETLILAKEILESEVDWCQGSSFKYDEKTGEMIAACALGALDLAIHRTELNRYTPNLFMDCEYRLINYIPIELISIPAYNDNSFTTKEDILLMFKRAIGE